ncbi:hypothetical protein MKW98_013268 [Papaver atlanticum]|uniref:Uncharacterized protein n=1 Tax=Papaver atlanticum TaxID=357466 RepID=A0AAD4XE44_9MAGN|nr:hypothetical protein MKW98_013268 [Papaver atlanticum]
MFEVEDGVNNKKPILAQALKDTPSWDFFSPFYTADINSIMTPKWLERINLAIRLLLSGFNKETKKFTYGTSEECSLEAREFALIFKMRRIIKSEDFKRILKSKQQDECRTFLNTKFTPDKEPDCKEKITKTEVENKLRIAAGDESDPEHFVRLFSMWLCAVFFFPDSGTTSFVRKWFPHVLHMDKVSWPDHIVRFFDFEHLKTKRKNRDCYWMHYNATGK